MNEWIKDYEGKYMVTLDGRVFSYQNRGRMELKQTPRSKACGYLCVSLSKDNKRITRAVHRLVAECFIENPKFLPYINHIDGDKGNNHIENLEWCTPSENCIHARRIGLVTCSGRPKKPVIMENITTKARKRYESMSAAIRDGFIISGISNCCSGGQNTHKGYKWFYESPELLENETA